VASVWRVRVAGADHEAVHSFLDRQLDDAAFIDLSATKKFRDECRVARIAGLRQEASKEERRRVTTVEIP
jgi:hypothetical protein